MAMQAQDVETTLKVIVVGNGCVGKTSMINRYARGEMTVDYKKTIGTDFSEKDATFNNPTDGKPVEMKLLLWDTAGQEMFAKLTKAYYKGAGAVVYAFSTTDRDSFLAVEEWKRKVEEEVGPICGVLVQNKTDLIAEAKMTSAEVEDLAKRIGMKLYRICVKDNLLVNEVFEYLVQQFLAKGGADVSADSAVMGIRDGSTEAKAAGANGSAASNGSAAAGTAAAGTAAPSATTGTPAADANGAATTGKAFTLEPSVQRTGGKKSSCSCG